MTFPFSDGAFDTPAGPPPPERIAFLPVLRARAGQPLIFVSLAQQVTPRWVHWSDGRTVGCRAQYSLPCPDCDVAGRRRWVAFLPVLLWPGFAECIVELPQSAFYTGRQQNPAFHGCLRARWFLVKRPLAPRDSWVVEQRGEGEGAPDPLPEAPDVPAFLRRLWGLPEWAKMAAHVHRPRDRGFDA